MPDREQALALLYEHTKGDSLRRHGLAVEVVMRMAATRSGGDVDEWGITGLLHDFDYEAHPDDHPFWGRSVLEQQGYPEDVVLAIQGHANFSGVPRNLAMAKWLFALDELTGFVMAVAMVQPGREVARVQYPSVRKKLKDKAFARSVSREDISQGAAELGVELEELVPMVVTALTSIAPDLGLG
ncbi:MAG: HD domain-containing protein [Candidatus Dormibacteria bacterium]|jgi:predicted hydrolase (HD superfamily)